MIGPRLDMFNSNSEKELQARSLLPDTFSRYEETDTSTLIKWFSVGEIKLVDKTIAIPKIPAIPYTHRFDNLSRNEHLTSCYAGKSEHLNRRMGSCVIHIPSQWMSQRLNAKLIASLHSTGEIVLTITLAAFLYDKFLGLMNASLRRLVEVEVPVLLAPKRMAVGNR